VISPSGGGCGRAQEPRLIEVEHISKDIEVLRSGKVDYPLIDTPPLDLDVIENAIMKSDAVVIPVRPSFFDVDAVIPVVDMCKRRRRPYSLLLAAVDTKMPKLIDTTMSALVSDGPIFATRLRYLQPYIPSIQRGKSAAEIDRTIALEIDRLWAEVKQLAGKSNLVALKPRAASWPKTHLCQTTIGTWRLHAQNWRRSTIVRRRLVKPDRSGSLRQ